MCSFCNFIIRKKSGVVLSFYTTCRFQDHFCYVHFFRFIDTFNKNGYQKKSSKVEYHSLIRTRIDECVPFVNFFLIRKKEVMYTF